MHQHEALELFREAECLVDQQTVKAAIDRMASCIHADLANRFPVVLSVMHGGMIVGGELLTRLHFPLEVGYVHASRYGFSTVGSELEWLSPAPAMVQGTAITPRLTQRFVVNPYLCKKFADDHRIKRTGIHPAKFIE